MTKCQILKPVKPLLPQVSEDNFASCCRLFYYYLFLATSPLSVPPPISAPKIPSDAFVKRQMQAG